MPRVTQLDDKPLIDDASHVNLALLVTEEAPSFFWPESSMWVTQQPISSAHKPPCLMSWCFPFSAASFFTSLLKRMGFQNTNTGEWRSRRVPSVWRKTILIWSESVSVVALRIARASTSSRCVVSLVRESSEQNMHSMTATDSGIRQNTGCQGRDTAERRWNHRRRQRLRQGQIESRSGQDDPNCKGVWG